MIKKIGKIVGTIVLLLLTCCVLLIATMYRSDLAIETLESTYFLEHSNYQLITIKDLDEQKVTINVHYMDMKKESNEVIVLLHGAFSSSHTFLDWANVLVDNGYRVILIDLPNHGLTGQFSDYTVSPRRSAALVKGLLDELNITSCVIGGNSMGGGVSWYFASEYHHQEGFIVEGLLLIDAVYPTLDRQANQALQWVLQSRVGDILSRLTPKWLMSNILKGVYGSGAEFDEETLDRYYYLMRKEGNRKGFVASIQEIEMDPISGMSRLDVIKEFNIPVVVLWGQEDSWISVAFAYLFQEALLLDEKYIVIYADLGHVPMEEDPQRTIVDVLWFLSNK